MTEHDRLHARSAHLVDGGAGRADRDARPQCGLPRGRLADAGRQHTAHQDLVDIGRVDTTVCDRCRNCGGPELGRRRRGEGALERADRRASGGDDHNRC